MRVAQTMTTLHRPVGEENASAQKVVRFQFCHSLNPSQQVLVNTLAPKLSCVEKESEQRHETPLYGTLKNRPVIFLTPRRF